jgi:hypothetical protein
MDYHLEEIFFLIINNSPFFLVYTSKLFKLHCDRDKKKIECKISRLREILQHCH